MAKRSSQTIVSPEDRPNLSIRLEQVCFIILKVREFDAKDAAVMPDAASNASDDQMYSVLEDRADDPVEEELTAFIDAMSDDAQIDLVALVWLGRDDNTLADWPAVREEAARAHTHRSGGTASYLLGDPLVSDYLEEALSMFGLSCEEIEAEHL